MKLFIRKLGLEYVIIDADYCIKSSNTINMLILNPSFKDDRCEDVAYAFTLNGHGDRFLVGTGDFKPAVGLNDYDGEAFETEDLAEYVRNALGVKSLGSALKNRVTKIAGFFDKEGVTADKYKEPFFAYLYKKGVDAIAASGADMEA